MERDIKSFGEKLSAYSVCVRACPRVCMYVCVSACACMRVCAYAYACQVVYKQMFNIWNKTSNVTRFKCLYYATK